jgi:hypothetical protein
MNPYARVVLAMAAVVLAAFLGYTYLVAPNVEGPGPSDAPAATASQMPLGGAIEPGRWAVRDEFPVRLTFEVEEGWGPCTSDFASEQGICFLEGGFLSGLQFVIVDNVMRDPCDGTSELDPPVGPSVDDLVAAISAMEFYDVSPATDITISGFHGKELEITAPFIAGCDLHNWRTSDGWNGAAAGEVNHLRIVDVDGVRVVIFTGYTPSGGTPAAIAKLEAALDSVAIEAP